MNATIEYVKHRKAFGTFVASFQNTKFELAAMAAEIEAAQAMVDQAVIELVAGELSGADAAKIKLFCTEMQARVVDRCLQLSGGYGYIMECSIARLYTDAFDPPIRLHEVFKEYAESLAREFAPVRTI